MTDYNTKIPEIENEIPSVNDLVTTATLNTKATKIENKIPHIANLATKATLNTKATEIEIWLPSLLSEQKPQRSKIKYLIPQVLLLLLSQ